VAVIDPAAGKLLGTIPLGGAIPASLGATYTGEALVHGMGYHDGTLAAVAVGSNAVVFIDTATNKVKARTYVGRAPHEAFWTPDGREVWVSVRGQDFIQVLDGKTYQPVAKITVKTPSGRREGGQGASSPCSWQAARGRRRAARRGLHSQQRPALSLPVPKTPRSPRPPG
jgi:YVTN family beta-propeller protein